MVKVDVDGAATITWDDVQLARVLHAGGDGDDGASNTKEQEATYVVSTILGVPVESMRYADVRGLCAKLGVRGYKNRKKSVVLDLIAAAKVSIASDGETGGKDVDIVADENGTSVSTAKRASAMTTRAAKKRKASPRIAQDDAVNATNGIDEDAVITSEDGNGDDDQKTEFHSEDDTTEEEEDTVDTTTSAPTATFQEEKQRLELRSLHFEQWARFVSVLATLRAQLKDESNDDETRNELLHDMKLLRVKKKELEALI
uniref:Rho termination factor N-terminal domain-containing protein n=1 Tax=Globisporangium ultimum (strain ATCC 200006 / CBS 805.95 / DAOM BR144) TaxID=431595 RepID=K3WVS4_GLOUD